jgi:hypothetical protein
MFTTNKNLFIAMGMVLLSFTACKKSKSGPDETIPTEKTYSFLVSAGTPAATYLVQTGSLTEGTLTTAGNGVATTYSIITSRDGYYYGRDNSSTNLVKFTSDNKKNTIVKEIPFNQISWAGYSGFYAWKDDKTLLLFNCNAGLQFEYAVLNVESMTITSSGNINIPVPTNGDNYWGNSVTFVGNKLYISYCKELKSTGQPDGKAYVASIDYPGMNNIVVSSDTRFTYPSPYNLSTPGALQYNGSAYFLTSPTVWAGGGTGSPYGVYRIINGGTEIDNTYFYELTDRTKEETIGLFDLGNGKAIVKILDKTQIETYVDYGAKNTASYYVVDLINKTKTRINIPISRSGSYAKNVLVEDGKAYIVTNTGDGFYVYEFDPTTSTVKKGLKLDGVSSISRIDRIK